MMNGSTGSLGDHVNGKQVQSVDPPGLSSFNNGPRHRPLNALRRCRVCIPGNGATSSCMLGPGNFTGDELLSWCLRRPFVGRLPASSATLVTLESTEVFGLEAADVKYVMQHFRYTFTNERVWRSARYYSPGWRTWAAVAVQLAWRRYNHRKTLESLSFIRPCRPLSRCSSLGEEQLRLYTAILTSPKPNQDDDFTF